MRPFALAVLTVAALVVAPAHSQPLEGNIVVNRQLNGSMAPGVPTHWYLGFKDADGDLFSDFELEHEKYMHMVIVSRDLESFAHVHPRLRMSTGLFHVRVNDTQDDPDSLDALWAVRKPGPFHVFTEVKPEGAPLQEHRFTVTAEGDEQPIPLLPDEPIAASTYRSFFTADSAPGSQGDRYQITLGLDAADHHGRPMLHLSVNVKQRLEQGDDQGDSSPSLETYVDVTDLEPWLAMAGHAVMIGAEGAELGERVFRHMHAGHHGGGHGGHQGHETSGAGPDLQFMLAGGRLPPAGLYKVWVQAKHEGRILTFPFVLPLAPPPQP